MAEHRITTGESRPVILPPYQLAHAHRDTITKEIRHRLSRGIIEHSTNEWSSPMVLVPKKNGSMRFCVDYRKLNSCSQANAYSIPRVNELIDRVGQASPLLT